MPPVSRDTSPLTSTARAARIHIVASGDDLMRLVIDTASGKLARNEQNGEREIATWKGGVTL